MTESENFFKQYEQVRTLTDITSELDPEEEPYKSFYAAREILENSLIKSAPAKSDILVKICLDYQLAINYKLCNEISKAKEIFESSLEKVDEFERVEKVKVESKQKLLENINSNNNNNKNKQNTNTKNEKNQKEKGHKKLQISLITSKIALIKTHILQDLAIVLSQLTEPEKALTHLLSAKDLVDNFCNPSNSHSIDEKLVRKTTNVILIDQRRKRISAALLQTVFCLGQAYQQLGDKRNASKYIVNTLQLQYSQNQFSHKKWALDCAAISQVFMADNHFAQAAQCLRSAEYIINTCPKEEEGVTAENLVEAKSDIARCWVKLIVNFMEYTAILQIKSGMLNTAKSLSISSEINEASFSAQIKYTFFNTTSVSFKDIPFEIVMLETPIKATFQNSIKDMFLFAIQGIKFASRHFNIENGFVIDSIELAMDENMLWQYLACFETNAKFQSRMVKKRFRAISRFIVDGLPSHDGQSVDKLASADKRDLSEKSEKLNHQYYLDSIKQIWHTTSEIFADIMTLKKLIFRDLSEAIANGDDIDDLIIDEVVDVDAPADSSGVSEKSDKKPQNGNSTGQLQVTKSQINSKLQKAKFSINRAGLRAIKAALEFEKLFENTTFENDSERRAYLLTIMRKGRTFQTLIPNNDKEKLLFMRESRDAFSQVRNYENYKGLLREEEARLCDEFEKLLPQAADLIR